MFYLNRLPVICLDNVNESLSLLQIRGRQAVQGLGERLGLRKMKNILQAQAQAVFAGNVGCLLQMGRYLRKQQSKVWLAHPVDALWASYSGEALK